MDQWTYLRFKSCDCRNMFYLFFVELQTESSCVSAEVRVCVCVCVLSVCAHAGTCVVYA